MRPASEVREHAYQAVASSATWLMERVSVAANFSDEYTTQLAPEAGTPMPIAESIMALLNLKEHEYAALALPAPDDQEVNRLGRVLLTSITQHGLIGLPYVRPRPGQPQPVFVDAINYCLAAIAKLIRLHIQDKSIVLGPQLLDDLHREGHQLVERLLASQRSYRLPRGARRNAWSWTDDDKADSVRPPSLFFTTQAAITLLEVLFEAPQLLDHHQGRDLSSDVMDSLIDAKRYIIDTLKSAGTPEKIGWVNIHLPFVEVRGGVQEPESYLRAHGYPHFTTAEEGNPRISLYAIECLAFFRYYQTERIFAGRRERLRGNHPDFWRDFEEVAAEDIGHMAIILERFFRMMESSDDAPTSLNFEPVRIELPSGFNETPGGDPGCWYLDGTVPYSALSALVFGSQQFGFALSGATSPGQTVGTANEAQIVGLVDFILENAFDGTCFLHLDREQGTRLPAIYATGAALEPLLSSGLLRPPTSTPLDHAQLRHLVRELSAAVGLSVERASHRTSDGGALSVDTLRRLLLVAFCAGTVSNVFADAAEFKQPQTGRGKNRPFWKPALASPPPDTTRLLRANGVKLIDVLASIAGRADPGDVEALTRGLVEDVYLIDVVRAWLSTAKMERTKEGGIAAKPAAGETILRAEVADMGTALPDLVERMILAAEEEERAALAEQLKILRKDLIG